MLCFQNFDFKLTSEAKIQAVFTGREDMPVAFDFSHQGHALVMLYVQFLRELSRARSARSGAPWVTNFGKLTIRENLVMT